jgi:hypothetical protein
VLLEPADQIVVGHGAHCHVKISSGHGYAATRPPTSPGSRTPSSHSTPP